ncbi:Hypothetical predicted protein [Mytilus galloprovincialis]|uniref:Uncharacterized protein n=1 Tax=Mytilus galloprovincialis TaxID=29158 RepID=A0A8B6BQQ7_MYTGA|nr:Hypothetical predicted protein [Mytilus galloprovincialis]
MLLIFCLVVFLPLIEGSCSTAKVKTRQLASGRNITVCTLSNGLEILNGSTVNLASCETCSCGEKELSCCGVGALAGVGPTPPKHCKTIRDGCEDIMVLKADETRDCFTGKSILLPSHPLYSLQNMYDMAQQQYMATNNMNQGTQMANIAPQQFSGSNAGTGHMIAGNMIRANNSKVDARIAPQMTAGIARQMTAGIAPQMTAGIAPQMGVGIAPQMGVGIAPQMTAGISPQMTASEAQQMAAGIARQMAAGIAPQMTAGIPPQKSPVVKHYFDRNVVHPDAYDPYYNSFGNNQNYNSLGNTQFPFYNSLGNDPYYNSLGNMLYSKSMFN